MATTEVILDRWFAEVAAVYPGQTVSFISTEQDRFRNPVGTVLRESLHSIVAELLGGMNHDRLQQALEAIVRIRAVQSLTVSQAVGFVFPLRGILMANLSGEAAEDMTARIDQLALLAFEEYARCRERLLEVRLNERSRGVAVSSALAQARG